MQQNKIVYYVAVSLDGYIAGPEGDISQFVFGGDGVVRYQRDLEDFSTVIMGRHTYEFGYRYGLRAGQPAYPHMQHYLFSTGLELPDRHPQVHLEKPDLARVRAIRDNSPTDVYLCGGGQFAGWLLAHGLIDVLKLKVNPIVLGAGIPLFGPGGTAVNWDLTASESYEGGLLINTYVKRE